MSSIRLNTRYCHRNICIYILLHHVSLLAVHAAASFVQSSQQRQQLPVSGPVSLPYQPPVADKNLANSDAVPTTNKLTGRQLYQVPVAFEAPPPPVQAAAGAYGYSGYGDKGQPPVPPVPVGVASLPPRIDPLLGQEYAFGVYPYGEYGGYGYGYRPYYSGYNYPLWSPFGPPPQWFRLNDKVVGNV